MTQNIETRTWGFNDGDNKDYPCWAMYVKKGKTKEDFEYVIQYPGAKNKIVWKPDSITDEEYIKYTTDVSYVASVIDYVKTFGFFPG